jgi:amino acid permease
MNKNYLLAIATLMGTIIGVGLFAIPYVINKAGILPLLFYIIVLAIIQYFLHLLFAEVVLSTKDKHRLPGFVGKYVGSKTKVATFFIEMLGAYGSILAYIVIGAIFLHQLLNPYLGGAVFVYAVALFIFVSLITYFDMKMIAGTELVLTACLILAIGLIAWKGFNHIDIINYNLINWRYIFLPYGPIFFAVGGGAAIPEMCRLLANQKEKIRSAIAWGTFIPAILMFVFVLVILGITGQGTTPDTLTGLGLIIKDGVVFFSLIFGLLAVLTSYIVISQAAEEVYQWDLGLTNKVSWFLANFVPFFLYIIGWTDLIKIIGFTGAVTGGLSGIILIFLVFRVKDKREISPAVQNKLTKPLAYFLSSLFILGLIYEVWNMFK